MQASYPVQFVDVWLWKCEVPSRLDAAIVNKLVTEQLKPRSMLSEARSRRPFAPPRVVVGCVRARPRLVARA